MTVEEALKFEAHPFNEGSFAKLNIPLSFHASSLLAMTKAGEDVVAVDVRRYRDTARDCDVVYVTGRDAKGAPYDWAELIKETA